MSDRESAGDATLIERTLEGDEAAFEEIVRRHQRKIFRVAWAILRDETEADTVTQDTFVQAFLHIATFERRSGLETWLTRIAINRSKDVLRARKWLRFTEWRENEPDSGVPQPVDERPDAEREAMSKELQRALDRSVDGLSAQQKMVFRMRHYEDRSLEDIAKLLGLRPGTVRAHLFRAVRKIRKDLGAWFPGGAAAVGERG